MDRIYLLKKAADIHDGIKMLIIDFIDRNKSVTIMELRKTIQTFIQLELTKQNNIENKGLAFPIGISGDSIVAHYTPTKMSQNQKEGLTYNLNPDSLISDFQIIKIDYGIHLEGNIIDKAFSVNVHDGELQNVLIESSECAVNNILKSIGVDSRLNELAKEAIEIVESFEYKDTPIKIVENVYSHNILPWKIHGNKFIKPDFSNFDEDLKVEENEQYAIEIYTSNGTGKAKLVENPYTHSHFRLKNQNIPLLPDNDQNTLVNVVKNYSKTLPFCPNIIDISNLKLNKKTPSHTKIIQMCQKLQSIDIMESYPPIIEEDSTSYVAQIEKNIILSKHGSTRII